MLKVRVVEIFTRTNTCVKVRVAVIFTRTNTCVKGQSSCDLYKDEHLC